ncbi:MAG TPA: hypothetical protein VGC91_10265 [Pyrinomonadaceae bacterium]|jgi:hypothetical protein
MAISRREFIRAGSVLAISAGLSLGLAHTTLAQQKRGAARKQSAGAEIPPESQRDALAHMTRTTFTQYMNTTFMIDPGYTFPIETTLVEVRDLRSAADQQKNLPGKDCFVLAFKVATAPNTRSLKQGTYQIRHDALGNFEMFVVPIRNKEGELFFEATINRLTP